MNAFEPYWKDILVNMTTMEKEELQKFVNWTDRMHSDKDFANQWLYTVKTLFDIEDINKNTTLEKSEFLAFIKTLKMIGNSGKQLHTETTDEKCLVAWNACNSLSEGDRVSWNDFCKSRRIIQAWSDGSKMSEDIEKMKQLG